MISNALQCNITSFNTFIYRLRRYLVAREWDVDEAEIQLKETLEWRLETKPQTVQCATCIETPGSHAMVGESGHSISMFSVGAIKSKFGV